jgi:hypothetical protein
MDRAQSTAIEAATAAYVYKSGTLLKKRKVRGGWPARRFEVDGTKLSYTYPRSNLCHPCYYYLSIPFPCPALRTLLPGDIVVFRCAELGQSVFCEIGEVARSDSAVAVDACTQCEQVEERRASAAVEVEIEER